MKRILYVSFILLFSLAFLGCEGRKLTYREGSVKSLAERMEQFSEALKEKFETEGITDQEWEMYKSVYEMYCEEFSLNYDKLSKEERRRIAQAAGIYSGISMGRTASEIEEWIEDAATMLPGYLEGVKRAILGDDEPTEEHTYQDSLIKQQGI
ncbi:MAG: hypothetical protein UHY58_03805 [Alistipes sp.]|jgi:hypothetical protein|nr:hypothetical protein [Alistipes sp.]